MQLPWSYIRAIRPKAKNARNTYSSVLLQENGAKKVIRQIVTVVQPKSLLLAKDVYSTLSET